MRNYQMSWQAASLLIAIACIPFAGISERSLLAATGSTDVSVAGVIPIIPADAHPYLPELLARAKEGTLRPKTANESDPSAFFDISITQDKMDRLLRDLHHQFTDINFSYDWDDDTVNAYAWKDASGQRQVQILGGMLRHRFMQIEGVTLVLAHETGHHRAVAMFPNNTGDSGLACEGVSDYWATNVGLREYLNDGDEDTAEYKDTVNRGISQTYAVLTGGLYVDPNSPEGQRLAALDNHYCGHPKADCRRDIYTQGFLAAKGDKTKIPACHDQQPDSGFAPGSRITTLDDIIRGGDKYLSKLKEKQKARSSKSK